MVLSPLASLFAALSITFVSSTVVLLLWWYVAKSWLRPLMVSDKYVEMMVEAEMSNFILLVTRSVLALPGLLINAFFTTVGVVTDNSSYLCCIVILSSASLIWLDTHPAVLESWMVLRQCYMQEAINFFVLPTADMIVMLYNAVIGVFDFVINIRSAFIYQPLIVLFKCALHQEVGNLFFYISDTFFVFMFELNSWISNGASTGEWNILLTLRSIGFVIDSIVPIMNCFCSALSPLWEAASLFANELSVHYFINCLLDTVVRLFQVLWLTIKYFISYILPGINPVKPDFTNATNAACCALYNGGDAIEDGVFLIVEFIWGILGQPLPPVLRQLLSVHYGSILSHPLCGVVKVINMTAVVFVNLNDDPNGFLEAGGTGIQYLQFGFVGDEFRYGAEKLGEPFYVFNPAARAFVSQLALSVVGIVEFLLEWVIGNVWFAIWSNVDDVLPVYTLPPFLTGIYRYLNFLFYYFPNYWLKDPPGGVPLTSGTYTFHSALAQLYKDTWILAVAAGDLVGLFNNPLGCVVEHLLKSIISFITVIANIISFFMPIFTFSNDLATTARAVETETLFLELSYTADCLGTLISQFGNCTVTTNDAQDNLFCCTGKLITTGLDAIISLLQQVVNFFLDVLALPTSAIELCLFGAYNPSRIECMRIPRLTDPIQKLNVALCAFACAVANIIPVTALFNGFNCIFPPGDPVDDSTAGSGGGIGDLFSDIAEGFGELGAPLAAAECHSVTSCIGNLICSVLKIFTVPFTIIDLFFTQMIEGNPLTNLFDFLNTSATLLAKAIGKAADSIGILVDCAFCAFFDDGVDCSTPFYTLMHYVFVVPLVALAGSFGLYSFYLGRIVMSGLKETFNGNGYLGIYSIITKSAKLMGIVSEAANFWFSRVFSSIGLPLMSSYFNSINHGGCILMEEEINTIVAEVIALSGIPIPSITLCCESSFCVPFIFKKRAGEESQPDYSSNGTVTPPVVNGTVMLTPDTWLKYIVTEHNTIFEWPVEDTCRASIDTYMHTQWDSLTKDEKQHLYFCLFKIIWTLRTDNQTTDYLPNSTCDDAMIGLKGSDWVDLRVLEKSLISNCIMSRIYIDNMRRKANIPWFPQDWWTNEYRKMHFGSELLKGSRIYYQYMMDQYTAPSIMTTPAYSATWLSMGLNTSHYNGLVTTDDVLLMRTHYHLRDYFEWNGNATQYMSIEWVTTGAWSLVDTLTARMADTTAAFSDNVTDPIVYLPYTYHTDAPGGVSDGLFFDILSRIFSAINSFARHWANPVNLKKRASFFTEAKRMTSKLVKTASVEATRMSLEWWKEASHNISCHYGECDVNETRQFMYEYESGIRGLDPSHGNHSIIYRLGHWWNNFEMPTVKNIPVQRDGKNRMQNNDGTSHHNNNNETTLERLYSYIALIRKGSDGANNRVERLMSGYYMIRNRVYTKIIQSRINEIQSQYESKNRGGGREVQEPTTTTYSMVSYTGEKDRVVYHINSRPYDATMLADSNETTILMEKLRVLEAEARPKGPPPPYSLLLNRAYTTNALIRINGLLDLTCTSSSAILCAECFVVDQLVGRIEHGTANTFAYYESGQYNAQLAETMDHFAYSFDENATVRVGDSDELPVRWPWSKFAWYRILGDNTPNKLRFNDILNLTDSITDNFGLAIQNSTLYIEIDYSSANGIVTLVITRLFLPIINFFYRLTLFLFSPTGVTDATASFSFLLQNWVICPWNGGEAFSGTHKRFSIGEMLLGYVIVYVSVMFVDVTVLKLGIWGIIASTGLASMIYGFLFLNIAYNWAWLCWPAVPYELLQNINYFLVHTLLTKCEWFFSGLIKGVYNNRNCYPCSFALTIEMANCKTDAGFKDIFSNIVFFVEYYAPWLIQSLRNTSTPLYILYQIPFINERLNEFVNVDMNNPDLFALYWTCGTIITLIPHLIIAAFFLLIFKFFKPSIEVGSWHIRVFLELFVSTIMINYRVMESFFMMEEMHAFFIMGLTEKYNDASSDNSQTNNNETQLNTMNSVIYPFGTSYNMSKESLDDTSFYSSSPQYLRRRNAQNKIEYEPYQNRGTLNTMINTIQLAKRHYRGDKID